MAVAALLDCAAGNIRRAGLSQRVRTLPGDLNEELPAGFDVIMFCDVGSLSKRLLRSAYKKLPAGGLVVLADRYLSEDGTQPLDRLVEHFAGSSFGLATWKDMVLAVGSCGFADVKAENVYRAVWYITSVKPAGRARQSSGNNGQH